MGRSSAGILIYRIDNKNLQVLLAHPGGPFWKNKEEGAWSIPKGEINETEDPLEAAKREFKEETGYDLDGEFLPLLPVRLKSGKVVQAWALENPEIKDGEVPSNTISIQWPPSSGKYIEIPEIDKIKWCSLSEAMKLINPGQAPLIEELILALKARSFIS